MIARLTDPGFDQHGKGTASPFSRSGGSAASRLLSGLGSLAGIIRKARRELRVSRAEHGLIDVVVPPADAGPLSRQDMNDWICRTSKEDRTGKSG